MPYIEIVPMYGGADGFLVRAALDHGAKGLVVEGLGWGNVNKLMYAAIKDAIAAGVPVVITSRVPNGRVLPDYGWEGGGETLADVGAVMGDDLPAQKAPILLMLLLQAGMTGQRDLQAAPIRDPASARSGSSSLTSRPVPEDAVPWLLHGPTKPSERV